jgi:DNA repair exonuclease SbcCD ATPase subunit
MRFAISKLSNLSSCNIFIIDEGFSCFDSTNVNNLKLFFAHLKNTFDSTIIISHLDSIKSMIDNTLKININKEGFSNIKLI